MVLKNIMYLLWLSALLISSCATVIHGSKQNVIVVSNPHKASINIDGFNEGITPFKARLKRNARHIITLSVTGYQPYEITLEKKLDGWIFGNILFGGVIGIVIDAASGSMYRLTPKDVFGELKPTAAQLQGSKDAVYVTVSLNPAQGLEKIGQLNKSN